MDTEMDPQAHFNQWRESQRPEQRWPSVEVSEIVCAALSQKGKAMGTDGWSGAEVALFPISMWHDFMIIFQVFERRGQFPSIWSELRQSHLCENHARKMRTFFTRRLEPKTKSSNVFKWSLRPKHK